MSRLLNLALGIALVVALWFGLSAPALAQQPAAQEPAGQDPPAHISLVEGTAVLERDGAVDSSPASMPLLAGDRVRTQAGRVEVLFADGSTLHLDANSVVDFQSDEVLRLLEGRIRLNIPGPDRSVMYRIDAPTGWVEVKAPGEYRISLLGERGEVELAVLRGAADLVNENGATALLAGERAFVAAGAAPSQPYVFNSAAMDAFDRWSEARREQRLGISAQYLPAEVRSYAAALDHYGSWNHHASYGYVWYPRVHAGWRPYYHGRWSHLRPWGWTWIGHDPWAWPTHHFGRWGFSAGVWFWIPGRHWAPAWVSWGYAPGFVSWCPLGFNNRPIFSFVNVNVFGGRRFTPWHGWTVVPRRHFGRGIVNINVVNINNVDVRTRRAFAVRDVAPEFTGRAASRAQTAIRVAGTAVPRSGATIGSSSRDGRAGTAFRRRGAAGERLSGPGYPSPARQPRAAVPRSGTPVRSPGAVRERTAPGTTQVERTRRAAPRTSEPGATPAPDRGAASRRGVPRASEPAATPSPGRATPSPESATPSRRASPREPRSASPAPAPRSGGGAASSAPERSRAVPRAGAPAAQPAPAPNRATPSRRSSPRGGGGRESGAVSRSSRSAPAVTVPARSRAVPSRTDRIGSSRASRREVVRAPSSSVPGRITPAPRSGSRPGPDRSMRSSSPIRRAPDAPSYGAPRSIQRSASPAGRPRISSPSPRSASPSRSPRVSSPAPGRSPGVSRGAGPSSPARSVGSAPSRGGGGGGAAASRPSRSRGGQQSSGSARSRRGGQ